MTLGLLYVALAASPDAPLCEMTYVSPEGHRSLAIRVSQDGRAQAELRGDVFHAQLDREMLTRLRDRLAQYDVCRTPQRDFDAATNHAARFTGLAMPIRYADACEVTLPCGRLSCPAPAILATRLPEHQPVQQFEQLRADLEQVRSVVILGGPTVSAEILRSAREQFGKPVRLSTLVYADTFEGESVAHFRPQGNFGPLVIVTARPGLPSVARVLDTHAQ